MWLINTSTLQLESVPRPESRPYAILSHTWEDGEVSFQDMMASPREARRKKGFAKIEKTCELARKHDPPLRYAWVDTCCIDKTSSAELTESINSMFVWYRKATVCYAFLSDLQAHWPRYPDPALPHCRWFTRGWTLQELIAPNHVEFYDCDWNCHGTKYDRVNEIASITGVDARVLEDRSQLYATPVGVRMSWASGRQTSRKEDMAYCLLGIFRVNMPMIYGEGDVAFIRLQKQIMEDSNDMTLFAWSSYDSRQMYRGILAQSPSEFSGCRYLERSVASFDLNKPYTLTSIGVRIDTYLAKGPTGEPKADYILYLGCGIQDEKFLWIGIRLAKTSNGFVRRLPGQLFYTDTYVAIWDGKLSTTYIRKDVSPEESVCLEAQLDRYLKVTFDLPQSLYLDSLEVQPSDIWDQHNLTLMLPSFDEVHVFLSVRLMDKCTGALVRFAIICELDCADLSTDEDEELWMLW